jgi:hypothetical protein
MKMPAPLPQELADLAGHLAAEPVAVFACELPPPPGINQWWEPVTIQRRHHSVASIKLTRAAARYKQAAEDLLLRQGVDVVALEDTFRDCWLRLRLTSFLATPMQRDVDGPVKPLQDLVCALLGVNDARVRQVEASLRLDPERQRVALRVEGYHVWDAGSGTGPYYLLKTVDTPEGRRSVPLLVTARRRPRASMTLPDAMAGPPFPPRPLSAPD